MNEPDPFFQIVTEIELMRSAEREKEAADRQPQVRQHARNDCTVV